MTNTNREYYWVILIIGVVIGLLSFLFPAGTGSQFYLGQEIESLDVWMIGYTRYYWWETGLITYWMNNPDFEIVNLISSISIAIILIVSLIVAVLNRKRKSSYLFLISGILLTGFTIYYIIGLELNSGGSAWSFMTVGFGVIGIFISSFLIITGFGVGFMDFDQVREAVHLVTKDSTNLLGPTSAKSAKFCPECGIQLSKENQKFCIECGTDI